MECYEGVKFKTRMLADTFIVDERLKTLNHWVSIFGELGLAPVHPEGAYGNHSYRVSGESFLITRTGMIPSRDTHEENYCVVRYDQKENIFLVEGKGDPSSECYLHSLIYHHFPKVKSIMHGHSALLNNYTVSLGIPETSKEYPYGTLDLAQAAVAMIESDQSFFVLKNHGFVATGKDIDSTAIMVLIQYGKLLDLLKTRIKE